MENKIKEIIIYAIATLLTIDLLGGIVFYFTSRIYVGLLWICYPALTLIVLGILYKKSNLILSQLMLIMVPDLLWIADFIGILITGNSFLGVASYFFEPSSLLRKLVTSQHLFTIPLSILALSIIKTDKVKSKLLLISFAELMGFFTLGFILPAQYGINCLPASAGCTSFIFSKAIPYPLMWIIVEFSFVLISYLILSYLPFIRNKKKTKD
jgi:hypothetical protein